MTYKVEFRSSGGGVINPDLALLYEHVWDVAHAPYYRHGCGMFAKLLEVPSSSCVNQRSVTEEGM